MEDKKLDEIVQESKMALGIKKHSKPDCDTFNFSFLDLLRPSALTFQELCVSYDKTHLFIIALIRVIFLALVTKLFYDTIKDSNKYYLEIIHNMLSIYLIVNILILLYIITKKQTYPKKD